MGRYGKPAVPALIQAIGDQNRSNRRSAIMTLREIGPAASSAIPALEKALNDPDLDWYARRALKSIRKKK